MKWNIYNRVTVLEQQVKDLTDFSGDQIRMIERLEEKLRQIDNKLFIQAIENKTFSSAPIKSEGAPVFTKAEVDQEKEKKRQYQRERYAKKKAKKEEEGKAKAQREKKNAYARAYYARTKGVKK